MRYAVGIGILVTLLLCLGVAGLAVGVSTNSWWKQDDDMEIEEGLWKKTTNGSSTERENILHFEEEERDKDIVLLLLIIGGAFGLITLFTLCFILLIVSSNTGLSAGKAFCLFLLTFLTVSASASGVIYSEIQFKDKWDGDVDRGYSVISVYAAVGCLILAMFLSVFQLISLVKEHNRSNGSSRNKEISSRNLQSVKGYELK